MKKNQKLNKKIFKISIDKNIILMYNISIVRDKKKLKGGRYYENKISLQCRQRRSIRL